MPHRCPTCQERELDTLATLPYVRGFLIAYQIGTKKFIGCRSCVRKSIFKEVGLSAVVGWFSITALVINPFLLVYGVFRGAVLSPDPAAVRKALAEAGIPADDAGLSIVHIAYGLAAAMIAADGKIEREEVSTAIRVGANLFEDFEADALLRLLQRPKDLPDPVDLAGVLAQVLDEPQKLAVYRYLEAIAGADGEVSADEAALLQRVHSASPSTPSSPPPESPRDLASNRRQVVGRPPRSTARTLAQRGLAIEQQGVDGDANGPRARGRAADLWPSPTSAAGRCERSSLRLRPSVRPRHRRARRRSRGR
ncbi:TerB family tellurite resistance protein [Nannocystis pusilla]|uniref:tellurite resistance TerB family protein n=1 Tax=Nannocystis pusilla TaxID=889268 RepID=UPI003B77B02A